MFYDIPQRDAPDMQPGAEPLSFPDKEPIENPQFDPIPEPLEAPVENPQYQPKELTQSRWLFY